ncbi:hypothetical protein BZG36_02255 [Bifiguratus adelaidae]|uniref:2-isopropylmalate synthase n=1 Tax=Bifiguratus adelaidae TaxID=1938954 RepID=A0A261Y1J7_9FUNG|nr:hypothetical protein BZG36_02255 [Bifiguratus adelaidae]
MAAQKEKLIIFDTTLRDGEQSPGVTLNNEEKVEIARHLSRLGVDVIEAGYPMASHGDFDAVHRIAKEVGPLMEGREKIGRPAVIAGLARATPGDIKRCAEAIEPAPLKRIHCFLATSDIHLKYKLKITREECIERGIAAVQLAKSLCGDVEFSPEDAGRSDRDFLCQVLGKMIEAGATTLNIPDTVGYNLPEEYGELIAYLKKNTPGGDKVVWSTHCHNDLGLATANSLAGVQNGARQVEVAMNGIGERAGNTALEEVVMAIHTHPDAFPVYHTINTPMICRTSQLVSNLSGMIIQPNKAIVGRNAFLHESGIHQDGMLKNKTTYEIITPETVGVFNESLVLGKHSGRNAFKDHCAKLGFPNMPDAEFQKTFEDFKALCDKKKKVSDGDILALLSNQITSGAVTSGAFFVLKDMQVVSGTTAIPTATVIMKDVKNDTDIVDAAMARSGPIEAVFEAIQRVVSRRIRLLQYEVSGVGEGMDAIGKVDVKIASGPQDQINGNGHANGENQEFEERLAKATFSGNAAHTDIIHASAHAYVVAVNRMLSWESDEKAKANSGRSLTEERKIDV